MTFRKVYPEEGRVFLDGGLNNKFARALIPDNESPDCANVVSDNGAVGTRPGFSMVNTSVIATAVCDGLYVRNANDNSETMVAFYNGDMFALATTTFITIASGQSLYTAGQRMHTAMYEDYLFLCNGGINPYKWNGAELTRHGIPAPTTTMTVATNATGGLLSGAYRYKLTNVNSNLVESDVGPVTVTFASAVGESLKISAIPIAPASHGVSQRKLYRTVASGSTYMLVATIENNTASFYTDNVADASLGAAAPTDQGEPPSYECVAYHQDRLFMNDPTQPNYLWYTELGNPYVVKAANFIKVGDNTSDILKAIGVHENGILAFGENSIYVIYMPDTTATNWIMLRANSPFGSKSRFSIINYDNKVLFPAIKSDKFVGFAAVEGSNVEPNVSFFSKVVAGSLLKSDRIEPSMFLIPEAQLDKIMGIVYQNKAYIAVPHGAGQTTNNRIWVFDFSISNINKQSPFSWIPWTGITPAFFAIYGGSLYFGSSGTDGIVYKLSDSTYSDNGTAIDSYFWTKEFSGLPGEENLQKLFRTANILMDKPGNYNMGVVVRVDGRSDDDSTYAVSLNPGGRLWGTFLWGQNWGGSTDQDESTVFYGKSGKRVQFKFSNQNTVNQRFRVHGLNFSYALKGFR